MSAIGGSDLLSTFNHSPTAATMRQLVAAYGLSFATRSDEPPAAARRPRAACARSPVLPTTGGASVIAVLALIAGVVAGILIEPTVPVVLQPYLPIAVVAALDAVFGGLRAKLDGVFDDKQFVISFVSNVLVAAFIVFLGDKLGVGGQLSTGVVVVFGVRIFGNVAAIRRHLFKA